MGKSARSGVGEQRKPERENVRAHVPAIGEQRHGVEVPTTRDLHDHHHRSQPDGQPRFLLTMGIALMEVVGMHPLLVVVGGHGLSCLGDRTNILYPSIYLAIEAR
ncbi:hypothetical protein D9M71_560920 [compost metagenome]